MAPKHPQPDERAHSRMVYRDLTLEVEAPVARADGTPDPRIPVALSSETPVERYDWMSGERYFEVLDHSAGGVNLSMARQGMPFLMDHNLRAQVGIIENVRLDSDRKLRGFVRMGNHPDASWIEKDIRGGIRTKLSIGYDPGEEYTVEKSIGDQWPATRVYRGWTPYEGSSVAVPADPAVGVGRSAAPVAPVPAGTEPGAARDGAGKGTMSDQDKGPAPAGPSPAEVRAAEVAELTKIADDFPAHAKLSAWIRNGTKPADALREVQAAMTAAAKPSIIIDGTSTPATGGKRKDIGGDIDMPESDRKRYNVARGIHALASNDWRDAGLEKEVSEAITKRSGRTPGGMWVPLNTPVDVATAQRFAERASVTGNIAATSSLGGAGVQTTIIGFIDLLRARTRVIQAGATVLTGLTDSVQFTRQITANTLQWVGENPATANTLTQSTLDTVSLTPKVAMSSTAYSRRLLAQFSFDVNAYVMNDLSRITAIGLDSAAMFGTGANSQPLGVRSQTNVTLQTVGANGAAAAWSDIVLAETNVANANADIGPMAWIASPKARGKWKNTLKSTTAGSLYIWGGGLGGYEADSVNGYPAYVSTNIPDNTTMGTSTTICSTPIFGVWDQLLIGEWGGAMDVVVDPYTFAQQNMIQVVTSLMVDVAVKQPTAFSVLLGVLTT